MTGMDKMNSALDYIEENITGEIDLNQAARKACCSVYHFLRTFSFLADMPLSEYIRRRRLSLAALDLCAGGRVIDVASKYGYSSPEAFSRAFKSMHGINPKTARDSAAMLGAYPKLTFHLSLNGSEKIPYRIVCREAYKVCGISTDVPIRNEATMTTINNFWQNSIGNGKLGQFHRDLGLAYDVRLNAALYDYRENAYSYMICYETPLTLKGYTVLDVPPSTWAVFSTSAHMPAATTDQVRSLRTRIFMEWFPASGYMHAGSPEFEMFRNDGGMIIADIWVPIIKQD